MERLCISFVFILYANTGDLFYLHLLFSGRLPKSESVGHWVLVVILICLLVSTLREVDGGDARMEEFMLPNEKLLVP